jgi:hypothetical protein
MITINWKTQQIFRAKGFLAFQYKYDESAISKSDSSFGEWVRLKLEENILLL